MFRIECAKPQRLQSTISDFLYLDEVQPYVENMVLAHKQICRPGRSYQLVIDVHEAKIQSQDVLSAIQTHIATFPPAERVGIVVGKSLNRYQALKLMNRPHVRFCDTIDEAQLWAFGEIVPANAMSIITTGGSGPSTQSREPPLGLTLG
jgi:hypothetical protein